MKAIVDEIAFLVGFWKKKKRLEIYSSMAFSAELHIMYLQEVVDKFCLACPN